MNNNQINYSRIKWYVGIPLFIFIFLAYLKTVNTTVPFWDTGEFIACAATLGVPHPPGYPSSVLLGRVFALNPIASIAMDVNFISTLFGSLAMLLAYMVMVEILELAFGKPNNFISCLSVYGGAAMGTIMASFTKTFWDNTVEVEAYSINTFFFFLFMYMMIRWYERAKSESVQVRQSAEQIIYLLSFLMFGFAFANHQTIFMAFPFIAIIVLSTNWRAVVNPRVITISILLAILGFSVYLYLPIRSYLNPYIDENNPQTWEGFKECLLRRQYKPVDMSRSFWDFVFQMGGIWRYFTWQFTPSPISLLVIVILGIIGFVVHIKRSGMYKLVVEFFKKNSFIHSLEVIGVLLFIIFSMAVPKGGTVFVLLAFVLVVIISIQLSKFSPPKSVSAFIFLFGIFFAGSFGFALLANSPNFQADPTGKGLGELLKGAFGAPVPPEFNEVRDRDYFFIPSFIVWSLWVGVAISFFIQLSASFFNNKQSLAKALAIVSAVIFLFVSLIPFYKNFQKEDATDNFIAHDYGRNMLASIEPNGVIFTNGDNDTFPLWFLQEVHQYRKDITVINLSLLNTPWYIQQLREQWNVPMVSYDEIRMLINRYCTPDPQRGTWVLKEDLPIPIDNDMKLIIKKGRPVIIKDFAVYSTLIKDYDEKKKDWKRPIYVAVTVADLMGLDEYLTMEGLVFKLVKKRERNAMTLDRTQENLHYVYHYVGIEDEVVSPPTSLFNKLDFFFGKILGTYKKKMVEGKEVWVKTVFKDDNASKLISNYAAAFSRLAYGWQRLGRNDDAIVEIKRAIRLAPDTPHLKESLIGLLANTDRIEEAIKETEIMLAENPNDMQTFLNLSWLYERNNNTEKAIDVLKRAIKANPDNYIGYQALFEIYQRIDKEQEAKDILKSFISSYPKDPQTPVLQRLLQQYETSLLQKKQTTIDTVRNRK